MGLVQKSYVLTEPQHDTAVVPELDAEQQRVLHHRGGPLLVLAGPGTGKTTTLVETVAQRILSGELTERAASLRTLQRRFLKATGLSQRAVLSIERAREAVARLERGTSIPDVIDGLGYADQPHLTKSLRHLTGRTPARILREVWPHSPLTLRELKSQDRR